MSLRRLLGVAGLLLALHNAPAGTAAPRRVLTTVAPVYCLTVNIATPFATVENLLPAGSSAHDFQLTFGERRKLQAADLIIANGLGLEAWLEKALGQAACTNVVRVAEGLEALLPGSPTHNPHVWLDPNLASQVVTNILRALQHADPGNAAGYASNAMAFVAKLGTLDRDFLTGLSTITNRAIVTSHAAFDYMARRYGLTIAGVVEEQPEVDPSPARLTALRKRIQEQGVKALFADPHEGMRRYDQLGRDFGVAVGLLDTLEAAPLRPSAYEEGMRRNLQSLRQHLK